MRASLLIIAMATQAHAFITPVTPMVYSTSLKTHASEESHVAPIDLPAYWQMMNPTREKARGLVAGTTDKFVLENFREVDVVGIDHVTRAVFWPEPPHDYDVIHLSGVVSSMTVDKIRETLVEAAKALRPSGILSIKDTPSHSFDVVLKDITSSLNYAGLVSVRMNVQPDGITILAWRTISEPAAWAPLVYEVDKPDPRKKHLMFALDALEIAVQFSCAYLLGTMFAEVIKRLM
jgi:hypothetical protein